MAGRAEAEAAKIDILVDALYQAAVAHGSPKRLYSQRDLLDLDVIPQSASTIAVLMQVIQALTKRKLFVGVDRQGHGLAWRWRSRDDADKYYSLPDAETALVYQIIDDAGADGVWNRTIKYRLNMHDSVIKTCIKHLESRALITSMKSVEHLNKKMYIRADLRPSDRATGGAWFTDGELDRAFVQELQNLIFEEIKNKSAYMGSLPAGGIGGVGGSGGTTTTTAAAASASGLSSAAPGGPARSRKRTAADMAGSEDKRPHGAVGSSSSSSGLRPPSGTGTGAPRKKSYLSMPSDYMALPTVRHLAQFMHKSGVTNNTTLSEADVQQLVDVLVFDGLVESVPVPISSAHSNSHGGDDDDNDNDDDDDGPAALDKDGKPLPRPRCRAGYRVARSHRQDTVPYAKRMLEREREGAVYVEALTGEGSGGGGGGGGGGGEGGGGGGMKNKKNKAPMMLTDPLPGAPPLISAPSDATCGGCPVFDLCEMGGTVSSANCEYFAQWLGVSGPDAAVKKELVEI